MAGGMGLRLGGVKKFFLKVCGRRLIDVVISVAKNIENRNKIYVCMRSEDVDSIECGEDVEVVVCPGLGYVEDLSFMLQKIRLPVLVLPADMPFLSTEIVEKFLVEAFKYNVDVVTLVVCRNNVCRESGISLFKNYGGEWINVFFDDIYELRDVDTYEDLVWAEKLCESMGEIEKQE